jgi:hypothetical protein
MNNKTTQEPDDLGPEVESENAKALRMAAVEAFAVIIKDKRTDAIHGRAASGIEREWQEDEDHYEGYDNHSRNRPTMLKGRTLSDGPVQQTADASGRSTVFLKITRPYCDAAAARFADMVLPSDDRNWAIKPTPKPDLIKQLEDSSPYQPAMLTQQQDGVYQPMTGVQPAPPQKPSGLRKMLGSMFGMGGQEPAPEPQNALTVAQVAQQDIDKAKAAAERAQEQIDDWHVECRYHAEVRKVLESAARVGTGILKGPHPGKTRKRAAMQTAEGWAVTISEEVKPLSKYVKCWNFFPDPSCGDEIQRGSYVFEVDDITARKLMDLKGGDYLDEMIDMCIEEGPTTPTDGTRKKKEGDKTSEKDLFQIWYFHGQVSKKDMEAAGCECGNKDTYPCVVTMVNDRVIKIAMSPLDSGEFPYDVMVWQERLDHWAGVGVARQMRECQKGANAAIRNVMDNAGLSAGPQIIVNRNLIVPANGRWELTPRKVWYSKEGEDVEDVRKAFQIVNIETLQAELMAILQFWLKEAEDVTGLPMLLQGQQGKAPDTVGGMQILNNNGTAVLRRIARNFDDRVTEPHIGRYYEYLLLYGPDDAKGEFTIDARGSSALVERDAQKQELMQMIGLSLNPAYGLDPELVIAEVLKSMRFDPKRLELSDEKKKEMASRQPPPDPRIQAAQILAASREKIVQMTEKVDSVNQQADREHETAENEKDRNAQIMVQMVNEKLATTELSSTERQVLERIKADLAKTSATLNLQRELTTMGHRADLTKHYTPQVAKGGAEPDGRAPDGQAFTK